MGCQASQTIEKAIDCDRLFEMRKEDQFYRNDPKANPVSYVADSLFYMENGYRVSVNEVPTSYSKRAYKIVKDSPASDFIDLNYSKSIADLCRKSDKKLTLELIDVIEMHDDSTLYNSACFRQALLVFVHTPNELYSKVDSLLDLRREAIPNANYNHIMRTFKHFGYERLESKFN